MSNRLSANLQHHGRLVYPRWKPGDEGLVRHLSGISSGRLIIASDRFRRESAAEETTSGVPSA